ncbi:MAG: thioredoxin-disulfide reductase [ANME-2 cluster archaeon]|nr:thioredoxin-disulfide reductase [ANME-2 cluster archaeon]MDF1556662.1 thioredoxin-disulfide reductase [ANME-2 cluster archaeon]
MVYDVIIIGGGPAGLSAGIYAKRAMMNTLLIEKLGVGGQIIKTHMLENYPGFPEISGMELMQKMEEHVKTFDLEMKFADVLEVKNGGDVKTVVTSDGEFETRSVIVATGTNPRKLGVPGEDKFTGKGVSTCATCDGFFFTGKDVALVGGGDSAIVEAIFLTKMVNKVYVIHRRDELRAEKINQERAFKNPKIEFVWNSNLQSIEGTDTVEKVVVRNKLTEETTEIPVGGVFMYVGIEPGTDFIDADKDEAGFLITGADLSTSIPGIFAAGDCRTTLLRQVATAVGDGALAAVSAERYIAHLE